MACAINATFHRNHYLLVSNFPDISLLVKYLAIDIVFEQRFGRGIRTKILLCNVFGEDTISISSRVILKTI